MNTSISRVNPLMEGNNSIEEQRIGLSLQDYLSASNTLEDKIIELLPEQIALLTLDENYSDRLALIIEHGNSTKNNLITSNQDSAFGRINLEFSQIEQTPPQFAEIDDKSTAAPIIDNQTEYNLLFSEAEASSFTDSSENVILQQLDPGDNPAFDLIGLTQLRNDPTFAGIDGSGFAVAVIDSGIDYNHPLLAPNYITGDDFVDRDNDPFDDNGHGTHVAGTIGAADETIGVAPGVDIIGLDVFDIINGEHKAPIPSQVDALEWVLDNHEEHNIIAVNMSLGGGFYTLEDDFSGNSSSDLIDQLEREGITVVAATGNSYYQNQTLNAAAPAIYSTLAVGAVWQDNSVSSISWKSGAKDFTTEADRITSFSQRLDAPNVIFAPGALIRSTQLEGDFINLGGTSMASPHVAGSVALLQEAALQFGGRLLTTDEVVEILTSTADTVVDRDNEDDNVENTGLSFPRLNIYNAVVELRRRFEGIAPPSPDNSSDPNGTIIGAFIGPTLDGEPVGTISGIIGIDGNGTVVGDKDVDIFRFEVDSPGLVTIELGTRTDDPNNFDSYLRLFDVNGNEIASNDDIVSGVEQFSRIETELAPGTYYAGVSGYNNDSYNPNVAGSGIAGDTGNYSLQLSLDNNDPNGLISGAIDIILGNDLDPLLKPGIIGSDYGNPVGVSDVDLYRIVIPDNGVLFIDIDTPYGEGEYVDSFLRLFNEEGEELVFASSGNLAESDDDLSFDADSQDTEFVSNIDNNIVLEEPNQTTLINGTFEADENYTKGNYGHSTDSFLGVEVERGKVYYLGVSDYFNSDYDPTNLDDRPEIGTGGSYELVTTFINNDINGSISQITSATDLPLFNIQENIGRDEDEDVGDRDVDFWKFNSPEAGILEIDIDSIATDTIALLFDGEGRLLAENDNHDGLDPLLQYQITPNTDYFLAITGDGNQNFDPFGLGTGSGGSTGAYTINASLLNSNQFSLLSDNSVDSELVQNITLGRVIAGNVGEDNGFAIGAEDIDLYRFIAEKDAKINIRVGANEEFSADTFLRLFDSQGNEIAFNDNETNLTRGSFLQQEVAANTEYIIGVSGNSDNARNYNPLTGDGSVPGSQGNYTLSVTESETTPLALTGGTAQIAYVAYYGRPADKGGLDFWNDGLTNSGVSYSPRGGDPLTGAEQDIYNNIVNQFGNSAEADRLFGAIDSNRDKVNKVYQFAFNRDGDDGGLDFWTEQIDLGNVTLATFALEVALGAQNEDIVVLNNKINSADLFSNSIDTEAEIEAYRGSTGEIFGRDWLGGLGDTASSQTQVDEALTNLVNN